MKSNRDTLTNEKLKSRFTNQFDLVNHAIKMAEELIASGRVSQFKVDGHNNNIALQILEDVTQLEAPIQKSNKV